MKNAGYLSNTPGDLFITAISKKQATYVLFFKIITKYLQAIVQRAQQSPTS